MTTKYFLADMGKLVSKSFKTRQAAQKEANERNDLPDVIEVVFNADGKVVSVDGVARS